MKDVWVDLLCWGSVLKIIFLSRKISVRKIYYINTLKRCPSVLIWFLGKLIKKPVIHMDWISEGEERIGNMSLYEMIQLTSVKTLEERMTQKDISEKINDYCGKFKYNRVKFREHLKETAYWNLFRMVEIQVISKKVSGENNAVYVIRKTPVSLIFKTFMGIDRTFLYTTVISHRFKIQNRLNYAYDLLIMKKYYSDGFDCLVKSYLLWGFSVISNMLFYAVAEKKHKQHNVQNHLSNIGIELIQSRVRLGEINDAYWVKDSDVKTDSIYGIEFENYDEESKKILTGLGIRRCRIMRNPLKRVLQRIKGYDSSCRYITATQMDWIKTFPYVFRLLPAMLRWNESGWFLYQEFIYACNVEKWKSVYSQLGIRVLWSLHDIDPEKLTKSQAMENLDGLFCGGHWSNSPVDSIETQKCCDVLFTWGTHFIRSYFYQYPYLAVFIAGYPLDYYFKEKKSAAENIRQKYPGKFILSYHDNATTNDAPCSKKMQMQIYGMLVSLINKNKDLEVFLKPKRKHFVDEAVEEIPELGIHIKDGRIAVFSGDTFRTKAVPAAIGMASDLVIGLGISTAASECHFAGAVSFHADFTGFTTNVFAENGLNKIVFRDIESLQEATEKQMRGDGLSYDDCRKYYEVLDPFQDGNAKIRTGFVFNRLQKALQMGSSREEAVKKVRSDYDRFIVENYPKKNPQKSENGRVFHEIKG